MLVLGMMAKIDKEEKGPCVLWNRWGISGVECLYLWCGLEEILRSWGAGVTSS